MVSIVSALKSGPTIERERYIGAAEWGEWRKRGKTKQAKNNRDHAELGAEFEREGRWRRSWKILARKMYLTFFQNWGNTRNGRRSFGKRAVVFKQCAVAH